MRKYPRGYISKIEVWKRIHRMKTRNKPTGNSRRNWNKAYTKGYYLSKNEHKTRGALGQKLRYGY